jgi:hypothetical protein
MTKSGVTPTLRALAVVARGIQPLLASVQERQASAPKIVVGSDGAVEPCTRTVFLSPSLGSTQRLYPTEHLHDVQNSEMVKSDKGVPRL